MVAKSRQRAVTSNSLRIGRSGAVRQELRRIWPGLYKHAFYACPRQFIVQHFSERLKREFACAIGCAAWKQESPHDRRDMDEQPGALRPELRQNGSRNTDWPHEVDIHCLAYLFFRETFGDTNRHKTGIVHHNVNASLLLYHLIYCAIH